MLVRSAAIIAISICASSSAFAQDLKNEDGGHFAAKLMLGFGGEAEVEVDDIAGFEFGGQTDMEMTYGLGLAYMHPLHEYFALGGQLALLSWTTDGLEDIDADRSSMIDVSLVPQAKYAVMDNLELYASLPLGLTFGFFGEDEIPPSLEVGGGFGFNAALMLGARVALSDGFGLLGELGYAYHAVTYPVEEQLSGADADLDISMGQLALNLGVWFQL
jgi:hypothetical protein